MRADCVHCRRRVQRRTTLSRCILFILTFPFPRRAGKVLLNSRIDYGTVFWGFDLEGFAVVCPAENVRRLARRLRNHVVQVPLERFGI